MVRQNNRVYVEITNVCNLRCPFCPGTKRTPRFLSPEEFALLAPKLRPYAGTLCFHLMGEPLLHPRLETLLDTAADLGFQVMFTTNGVLLPERGDILCRSRAVYRVSVSLQAWEANGLSPDYLAGCIAFARRAGAAGKRCVLRLWNLDGEGTAGLNRENGTVLSLLRAAFPPPWQEGPRGTTLAPNIYLEWGETFDWPDRNAPDRGTGGFCRGLVHQLGVLCDGTVVPCCLDHEGDIPLGNLFRQNLADILDGDRAKAMRAGFSRRVFTEDLCRRCGYARRFDR